MRWRRSSRCGSGSRRSPAGCWVAPSRWSAEASSQPSARTTPALALEGALHWGAAAILLLVATTVLATRKDASHIASTVITVTAVIVAGFGFMQKAGIYAIVGEPFNTGLPNSFFSYYTVYAGYRPWPAR